MYFHHKIWFVHCQNVFVRIKIFFTQVILSPKIKAEVIDNKLFYTCTEVCSYKYQANNAIQYALMEHLFIIYSRRLNFELQKSKIS
jgi:hypothetical protein